MKSASTRQSGSVRSSALRTKRWVNAWLIAAALLAVLLFANSIHDYLRVWRILATQQVRHAASQYVVDVEQRLRRAPSPVPVSKELLTPEAPPALDDALWIEVRRPDGSVLARHGNESAAVFTAEEQTTHFRAHQPLYRIVSTPSGEAVVEVFPLRPGFAPPPTTPSAAASVPTTPSPGSPSTAAPSAALPPAGTAPPVPGAGRGRAPLALEIAAPLAIRDASVLRSIRQSVVISCSGALALFGTVLVAAAGFRSYERGRRLESQLEVVREVQSALLPSRTNEVGPLQLAAVYRPAEEVSGDFYDVFGAESGRVALVVGDVAGKGLPAALVTGVIHGAVRSAAWTESQQRHEVESARLNRLLCTGTERGRHASMFWAYYDPTRKTLHYVNAGHLRPMLIGRRGHGPELVELDTGGPVLGLLEDASYRQGCRAILPGDTLLLFSDGIVEAESPAGEEYGEERVREVLEMQHEATPQQIQEAVLSSLGGFLGAAVPRDDVTLVVARFTSQG